MHYTALLTLHANLLSTAHESPADFQAASQTLQTLRNLAASNKHQDVVVLADVIRLRTLVTGGMWEEVGIGTRDVEKALGMDFTDAATPLESPAPRCPPKDADSVLANAAEPTVGTVDAVTSALQVHTLIMAITFYTMSGNFKQASIRLLKLHEILDSNALAECSDGFLRVILNPSSLPLLKS